MKKEYDGGEIRPTFKKSSSFKGSKKKYQKKVWKAAGRIHPDIDQDLEFFKECESKGLDTKHVMDAIHYNTRPLIHGSNSLK